MENSVIKSGRIPDVDLLKGFAMICMIVGHSIIVYPINISHYPWCESLHNFIYSFHMELLFLLSGFLYKNKNYINYLKGKVNRILVPYLIWGSVFLLMPVLFSSVVHRDTPFQEGLKNYLFHGGGYWFLYVLFLVFFIYPIIDKLANWAKLGLALAVFFVNIFHFVFPAIFCIELFMLYLPYFIIGNLLKTIYNNRSKLVGKNTGVIGLGFVFVFLINQYVSLPSYYAQVVNTICIMGWVCITVLFFYVVANVTKDIIINKLVHIMSLCGKYSLQLYLFNGFLLVFLRVILCSILHIINPIVLVAAISGFDIIISLLICVYLLPKSRVVSFICGVKA